MQVDKPVLLDLFCGAGGSARGYQQAGFYVIGVDAIPQPRYVGEEFYVGDAVEVLEALLRGGWDAGTWRYAAAPRHLKLDELAAIHASPPCHGYSVLQRVHSNRRYIKLIEPVRELLQASGRPYVIENVKGAPLRFPVLLCGSMFGLGVNGHKDGVWRQLRRHRMFESNVEIYRPMCRHQGEALGVYGNGGYDANKKQRRSGGYQGTYAEARAAMGVHWMTRPELTQAIPPAYTAHIGAALRTAATFTPARPPAAPRAAKVP